MEGGGRGKGSGSSLRDRSTKRRSSGSDFSSPNQLEGGSSSSSDSSSFNGVTPVVGGTAGASFTLADSTSAGERTGEIHERRTRHRTTRRRDNLVSSTPTAPEQMGPLPGDQMNPQQQGLQINSLSMPIEDSPLQEHPAPIRGQIIIIPDSAMDGGVPQVGDPRIRTRLTSELRNLMGLQDRGGALQYHSHYRVPGHWWLVGVVYQPDGADDDEDDDDDATVENMSYEELFILGERLATASQGSGCASTGLSEELIMAKMEQRKYTASTTTSPVNVELCCICQEEYADSDDIGKLDCRHEFHVACIKEWLAQKNSCPICKTTALAT